VADALRSPDERLPAREARRRTRYPGPASQPIPAYRCAHAGYVPLYEGACAVCHQIGAPALFGSKPSLALNSNLHSAVPDNLIQVILHGIASPVSSDLGYMPPFKDSLTAGQITELVSYLRQQFAPDKQP
jgi:mono/diheme cytochrome c family protein